MVVLAADVRLIYRPHRDRRPATNTTDATRRVVVFGADDARRQVLASLMADPYGQYKPVALLDENPNGQPAYQGVPVRGTAAPGGVTVARAEGVPTCSWWRGAASTRQ